MPHILIVDDDLQTRQALAEVIGNDELTIATAADLREARIQIIRQMPDAVFIDLKLPDGSGVDLFEDLALQPDVEVVVITGYATIESAVNALKMGATDYLVKPVNLQRVKEILSHLPRNSELRSKIGSLQSELHDSGRFGLMLGKSPAMQQVYEQISRVAPTSASVLLIGESGTGKEVAAQTLHELSRRRKQAFLAVNCGAISPNLTESEMFGHERGSFTGADRQHKGYFERANGGTLFLDEITEMPLELQVKMLRVLEAGTFMRIGAAKEIDTDVRLIAATNRDPRQAVSEGKLRLDLYHRLNVFPLQLPALRERGDDIYLLAQHLLDELNQQHGTHKVFPAEAKSMLQSYSWPGNVRELKNYVQRAYIMAGTKSDTTAIVPLQISLSKSPAMNVTKIPFGTSLAEADRQLILATLEQCGGIKKQAAEVLGITPKTLNSHLLEYGLQAGSEEPDDETASKK